MAAAFLREVVEALPYRVHTVLTDNGIQFTNRKEDRYAFTQAFGELCGSLGDAALSGGAVCGVAGGDAVCELDAFDDEGQLICAR